MTYPNEFIFVLFGLFIIQVALLQWALLLRFTLVPHSVDTMPSR